MKAIRISVLTMVMLVGATSRSIPTHDKPADTETHTLAQTPGPCYLVNGIWICES